MSLISIGGIAIDRRTHLLSLDVQIARGRGGLHRLTISATGWYIPDNLGSVNWDAPLSVVVPSPNSTGTAIASNRYTRTVPATLPTRTLTVYVPDGIQVSATIGQAPIVSWSMTGWELGTGGATVTIGGTAYPGSSSVSPIGGTIRRMSNGAGTLLRAWGKRAVTLTGSGTSVPDVSGTVAVVSDRYSGDLLVRGVSSAWDPETGLRTWTIDGEEP